MKAVSTLIAAMFIIFLLVAMLTSLVLIMQYFRQAIQRNMEALQLAAQRVQESLKVTQGPEVTSNKITAELMNTGNTYVLLTKYYVRDLQTNQVNAGNLNLYIPPTTKKELIITGTFNPTHNYTIILISTRYKKYTLHYPPPPSLGVGNVTYTITYTPLILGNYTVATIGYNSSESSQIPPTGYSVNEGVVTNGGINSLRQVDGDSLVIKSASSTIYHYPGFSSWRYFRELTIEEQTNEADLLNYTVKIVLTHSNFTFSHAKQDGSDVIFLWEDNETVLNSWIQEWNSSSNLAIIWVKIPEIPKGGEVKIYMLYGNPSYNNRNQYFYGLTKIMDKLPDNDGRNYMVKYENWTMPENLFNPNQGVAMGWHSDDSRWRLNLPFSFPYYSRTYSSVYVCSNGFIGTTYSGTDYSSTVNELKKRGMISPFWADLMTEGDSHDIFVNSSYEDEFGEGVYIRWYTTFYPYRGNQNFGVVLYKNGLIRFDYGGISGRASTDYTPVIGISFGDRTHYTLITPNNNEIPSNWNNHKTIVFWPRKKADVEPKVIMGGEESNSYEGFSLSLTLSWSGLIPSSVADLYLVGNVNVSSYDVMVYENSTGDWMRTYSGTDSFPARVFLGKYFAEGNSIGLRINLSSQDPFKLSLDYAVITLRILDLHKPLIGVVVNGSRNLLIYDPVQNMWSEVNLGGELINPYVDFSFSNMSFYILNYSEVLRYDPYTNSTSSLLTLDEPSKDPGIILSLSNVTNWLVYLPGGDEKIAYLYNLSSLTLFRTQNLIERVSKYTCIAKDLGKHGFIMFGGTGDLYEVTVSSDGVINMAKISLRPASPTSRPVGLAYGNDSLWVISEGGGVHRIGSDGSVSPLRVQPPYYPEGEGDRLAYVEVNGVAYLYHVREDGTSEVWVIKVG